MWIDHKIHTSRPTGTRFDADYSLTRLPDRAQPSEEIIIQAIKQFKANF